MHKQRRQADVFADGLEEWRRGEESLAAEAARFNVAALFNLVGNYLTSNEGKWSK
jgi:hypothetical protein